MPLDSSAFHDPAARVSRLVARELLASVLDRRVRLDADDAHDALHDFRVAVRRLRSWMRAYRPWLQDTVSRKVERQLKRIAAATGGSRDLEVQLDRVGKLAKRADRRSRPGLADMNHELSQRKQHADEGLGHELAADFVRTVHRLERELGHYDVDLDRPLTSFGHAAATLIGTHAARVDDALGCVRSSSDIIEAHQARIAAKRLRYLIEPMVPAVPSIRRIVDELKLLQDALGDMHDAHVFAAVVADGIQHAKSAAVLPGLRRLRERLRRDERVAYSRAASRWVGRTAGDRFSRRCARLAARIDSGLGQP